MGGKVAIYALDPSYVSRIHPKVSNETRKLGLFRLVKNRAKLVCFPTTDPSSELHTRVKSCQKLQKKTKQLYVIPSGTFEIKKIFFPNSMEK